MTRLILICLLLLGLAAQAGELPRGTHLDPAPVYIVSHDVAGAYQAAPVYVVSHDVAGAYQAAPVYVVSHDVAGVYQATPVYVVSQ